MRTAASYRQLAEMCAVGAAEAKEPHAKATYERLRDAYLELAKQADRLGIMPPSALEIARD
jgi:hypothetical protein